MSGGYREEGFAALLTVITEANEQGDWPGFVTPNFTTGTAIYARLFREVFSGATRRGLDYWSADVPSAPSALARILNCVKDCGRDVTIPSHKTKTPPEFAPAASLT